MSSYLTDEAVKLHVTIQTAKLPGNEQARYIHADRRIIIRAGLDEAPARKALAIALGHAYYGDEQATEATVARAQFYALAMLVDSARVQIETARTPNTGGNVISAIPSISKTVIHLPRPSLRRVMAGLGIASCMAGCFASTAFDLALAVA